MPDDPVDATRRTRLANERTLLAWWRAGFTSIAVGLAAGGIIPDLAEGPRWPYVALGAAFAALGIVMVGFGLRRYRRTERALAAGRYAPLDERAAVALAAALAVLGVAVIAMIVYVA